MVGAPKEEARRQEGPQIKPENARDGMREVTWFADAPILLQILYT